MLLERWLARRALSRRRSGYHSRFGGLWTDRLDAEPLLAARDDLRADERERLLGWIRDGYAILPGAVSPEACDALRARAEQAWQHGDPSLWVEVDRADGPHRFPLEPRHRPGRTKLLDLHARWPEARRVVFAPAVRAFLGRLFEDDPLAFQSLLFERGTEQDVHQDTTYVVVRSPLEMVGLWIALEDIAEGSGELVYYPGSHRLPDHCFGRPPARNWNPARDGEAAHREYLAGLQANARARGLALATFRPKRGDALFWSADLAHGGGPRTDAERSRWSFVTHLCPLRTRPYWFSYKAGHRKILQDPKGCHSVSSHYRL